MSKLVKNDKEIFNNIFKQLLRFKESTRSYVIRMYRLLFQQINERWRGLVNIRRTTSSIQAYRNVKLTFSGLRSRLRL